jgi:hypothetical protein
MIIKYLFINACGASTWLVPLATRHRVALHGCPTSSLVGILAISLSAHLVGVSITCRHGILSCDPR